MRNLNTSLVDLIVHKNSELIEQTHIAHVGGVIDKIIYNLLWMKNNNFDNSIRQKLRFADKKSITGKQMLIWINLIIFSVRPHNVHQQKQVTAPTVHYCFQKKLWERMF